MRIRIASVNYHNILTSL